MTYHIIDYGAGNLTSVENALNYLGASYSRAQSPAELKNVSGIIIPGVGSFKTAALNLERVGFLDSINELSTGRQVKVLGICLGFQIMASYGEEGGGYKGIGLIDATVVSLRQGITTPLKTPHVGFNSVLSEGNGKLHQKLRQSTDYYFLHSYCIRSVDGSGAHIGTADYGGKFVASYEKENVFGTQFHPEKSQGAGLTLLRNFLLA